MKIAVVFYSRTGTTEKVAKEIAHNLNADLLKIKSQLYPTGPVGYLRALIHAFSKKIELIEFDNHDLTKYEFIIIGTPIWGAQISAPVKSFLIKYGKQIKKVAFFATCGSTGAEATFTKMNNLLTSKSFNNLKIMSSEFKNDSYHEKIKKFSDEIRSLLPKSKPNLKKSEFKTDSTYLARHE